MSDRVWTSCLVAALAVAACAEGSTGGLGDEDGNDGDAAGGGGGAPAGTGGVMSGSGGAGTTGGAAGSTASSTAQASSSRAASSSSSSGGGVCDNTGDCAGCQNCALNPPGACSDEWATCNANPDCPALNACLTACPMNDQVCIDDCVLLYLNGAADLAAAGECVFCVECYVDCDGASQANCP